MSCRGEEKYKDMLMDIATWKSLGHVRNALCKAMKLNKYCLRGAPVRKNAKRSNMKKKIQQWSIMVAGMNPQHANCRFRFRSHVPQIVLEIPGVGRVHYC